MTDSKTDSVLSDPGVASGTVHGLPPLPKARIESFQWDAAMRTEKLYTHDAADMREYALAARRSDEALLTEAMEVLRDLLEVAEALRAWVKAVPQDTPLPAMPGYDGDVIASVLDRARALTEQKDGK